MTRAEDLTGEYCYFGPDFNVRSFGLSVEGIPFVDVRDLATPTLVSVRATPECVVFLYRGADGSKKEHAFDVVAGKAAWKGASLRVEWSGGTTFLPIPFAFDISAHSRESQLFKLADGRLVMTDSITHKGYSEIGSYSFSGTKMHSETQPTFHREERTVAVILDPTPGGCDAGTEGRPRQPWFEHGVDLRDPACAAQIEEELTAIMVAKDEEAEAAAAAASQALESLFRGSTSLDFSASCPPGKRYLFRVVKKKSGCVLKLYARERKSGHVTIGYGSSASRPLPACICND